MGMIILQGGGLLGSLGGGGGQIGSALAIFETVLIAALVGLIVFGFMGFIVFKRLDRKKYNINVQIIVPRSDGRIVEWYNALGAFHKSNRVGGITSFLIKRKGLAKVEIPPPRSDYLIGPNNTLLLAQKGLDDYEPIMPHNLSMVKTKSGKIVPILNLHAINQDATAWGFDIEETAKKRFTFQSMWEKYQAMITMMTFVFILFLVLYINWIGMKDVVTGLAEVAEILKSTTQPIISPGG